jgi:hypothetical protein
MDINAISFCIINNQIDIKKCMNNYNKFRDTFEKLKDFNDSDFLLAMGDPVAIAIASIVASDINNGRLKILKWDREHRAYYPVEIDIYNNRKENEDYVG